MGAMSNAETSTPSSRQDGLAVVGIVLSLLAVVGAVVGVGLGIRAVDEAGNGGTGVAAAAALTSSVSLTEFAVTPDHLTVAAGGSVELVNDGAVVHNLAVEGHDLVSADIAGGERTTFDLSGLEPGDYDVYCAIAGHREAGMTGTLTVTDGEGAGTASGGGGHGSMTWEEMDAVMHERTAAFPAETEGVGAQELAPTVLPDGTKQFELTASVFDWEVEPGKVVEAWGYNGQTPGPTIRVDVGDTVRVIVHNELAESTAVHFHGMFTPNDMDGVPDITQEPIRPGESFTYEFVAREAQVGMYHSHHNAHVQVTNGLLGAFYVGEMPLPEGVPTPAIDMPMVLNDAGTIGLSLNGKSFPATAPVVAKQGDWIKVDYMNEGIQIHPMHLHGMPQMVIAKDGWPLPEPVMMDTVNVAPGERFTVLIHATEPGAWAWHCHILTHAEGSQGMFGMVTALVVQ
jgi:manganese oxidase